MIVFISSSNSDEQIVYLDLDNVISNTKAGKSILNKLEKSKNSALSKFEKKEKDLKKIEEEIKNQKNVISEDELKKITPIIEQYVSEKKIDIVLDKKNVFVASKKKDITQEIINMIDSKIK